MPHEALAFFEGTWTTSDAKPEDEFSETCAWLPAGRRHMVCRSRWKTAAGPREGLSIFSHDERTAEYLYHGFRPGGAVVVHRGLRLPDGWSFTSERGEGEERVRTRVTIGRVAEGRFSFHIETARADGPWATGARLEYRRIGS